MRVAVFTGWLGNASEQSSNGFHPRYAAIFAHLAANYDTTFVRLATDSEHDAQKKHLGRDVLQISVPRNRSARLRQVVDSFSRRFTEAECRLAEIADHADVIVCLVHPSFWLIPPFVLESRPSILFAEEAVETLRPPLGHLGRFLKTRSTRGLGGPTVAAVITTREAAWAASTFPGSTIRVVPHTIDIDLWSKVSTPTPDLGPSQALVIGDMSSSRNAFGLHLVADALEEVDPDHFVKEIGVISATPADQLQLDVRGRRIRFLGRIDDPRPYYAAAAAVLVPAFYAPGTKTTVLQAWAAKRPVVTTSVCAEALDLPVGSRAVAAGETPTAVAKLLVHVMKNDGERRQMIEAGWKRVTTVHGPEALGRRMDELLAAAVAAPRRHLMATRRIGQRSSRRH